MTSVAPGPEQGRRRHVAPFEAAVDAVEIGRDEVEHLGRELVDEEGAAGADDLGCRLGDCVAVVAQPPGHRDNRPVKGRAELVENSS